MTARKQTELASRLAALDITPTELAAIISRPVEDVEAWVAGDAAPDGEAKILLRLIVDPARSHAATLAAERIRNAYTRNLEGDGRTYAQIEGSVPFGAGHHGRTGGQPV